jgi:hypothetical protein
MIEQIPIESKGKKPGLLRRVLWWVWVALLCVVLAGAVFFAAPWKAITLIGIFLAAATILPRRHRKWFWLGVGIVALATIAWIFLPEDNKDWRPYTFDKELAQLQAKYAVPDSENAAIAYNKILADWKQKEANEPNLSHDKFDFARRNLWLTKDQPEVAAYIKYYQDTVEQLIQASKLKQCSFPVIADSFILSEQMERMSTIRQWAYLLVAAGNNDIAEGNTNDAVEKYLAVLRMGQHMSRQPSVIEMLVGIAVEALGLGGIDNLVIRGDANEFYLKKAEQAVSEIRHNWNSDLPGFVDSAKLMLKNMTGALFYEVNSKGMVRFSHDPYARIREWTKEHSADVNAADADIFSGYWSKKLFKAYIIPYWFYAPETPEKLSRMVDASFEKNYLMTKPDFNWPKEPQIVPIESLFQYKMNFNKHIQLLAQMNMKAYCGLHDIYLRYLGRQRGNLLIIALRRYKNTNGQWPEQLEDVKNLSPAETFIDPINGGSFVYKRTEENFMLYSKGKNGIDEEGKLNKGCDDWMIWSAGKAAKSQQEKADAEQQ